MATDSLEDEMVKLVGYTIVSLKRDAERVMPGGEGTIIVTDSMTEDAFVAWVVARYCQSAEYKKMPEEERRGHREYLAVHYNVARRWARKPLKFEERQVEVLGEIRDALGDAGMMSEA